MSAGASSKFTEKMNWLSVRGLGVCGRAGGVRVRLLLLMLVVVRGGVACGLWIRWIRPSFDALAGLSEEFEGGARRRPRRPGATGRGGRGAGEGRGATGRARAARAGRHSGPQRAHNAAAGRRRTGVRHAVLRARRGRQRGGGGEGGGEGGGAAGHLGRHLGSRGVGVWRRSSFFCKEDVEGCVSTTSHKWTGTRLKLGELGRATAGVGRGRGAQVQEPGLPAGQPQGGPPPAALPVPDVADNN